MTHLESPWSAGVCVLGASVAAEPARRGAQVTLLTDGPLASGGSGRSLSWLNSYDIRSEAGNPRLTAASSGTGPNGPVHTA